MKKSIIQNFRDTVEDGLIDLEADIRHLIKSEIEHKPTKMDELKVISLVIPKIEKILAYNNVSYYEKCVLIKQIIEDWRND